MIVIIIFVPQIYIRQTRMLMYGDHLSPCTYIFVKSIDKGCPEYKEGNDYQDNEDYKES